MVSHLRSFVSDEKIKCSHTFEVEGSKLPSTSTLKRERGHTIITSLSGHNERKTVVLLAVFDKFLTVEEVARKTFSESLGIDFKHHKRNTSKALNKYLHFFKKPYLISKFLKRKGRVAYKCSPKGQRMACELNYRRERWLSLNWKRSKRHKWNNNSKFNIVCRRSCLTCKFNPKQPEQKKKSSTGGRQ